MLRNSIASLCLVILSAGLTAWGDGPATGPSRPVHDADHAEIPAGKLGFPLGTYLSVAGIRPKNDLKAGSLVVHTVNGKKLDTPVILDVVGVSRIPDTGGCQINGYETGAMIGIPSEVARIENLPQPQARWQFHRTFIATSIVEPKDLRLVPERQPMAQAPALDLSVKELDAISADAFKAMKTFLHAKDRKGDDIPKELWGEAIERLKPVRVVNDKANVKIVLAESPDSESGLYVTVLISSYHPVGKDFAELVRIPDIRDRERSVVRPIYRYRLNKKP